MSDVKEQNYESNDSYESSFIDDRETGWTETDWSEQSSSKFTSSESLIENIDNNDDDVEMIDVSEVEKDDCVSKFPFFYYLLFFVLLIFSLF